MHCPLCPSFPTSRWQRKCRHTSANLHCCVPPPPSTPQRARRQSDIVSAIRGLPPSNAAGSFSFFVDCQPTSGTQANLAAARLPPFACKRKEGLNNRLGNSEAPVFSSQASLHSHHRPVGLLARPYLLSPTTGQPVHEQREATCSRGSSGSLADGDSQRTSHIHHLHLQHPLQGGPHVRHEAGALLHW